MTVILNSISPAEATRERQALRNAGEKVLASAYLRRKFLKELGLEARAPKNFKVVSDEGEEPSEGPQAMRDNKA